MRFTFIQPVSFAAEWKRLGLTDTDLQALETVIMEDPEVGDVVRKRKETENETQNS
ncbi:MAG: hypothetical protein JWN24_4231 [Phycisphaerales bacterium]|nr:hypothetical protein [Phycisphaerales bacterium]